MDNIEVLLKAAEYIESQETVSNDSNAHNHLSIESSLSPISSTSYSSSSSSSLFNSPNNFNYNNYSAKNERVFHKKFNNRKLQNYETNTGSNNETNSSFIYSSSLPSNLISPPNLIKARKNDEKSLSNKSLSRLEEIKRDKAIHNTLEKNRRAHLKDCFENLQNELPQYKDKKCTNLAILNYTLKYVEQSKKKDKENEMEKGRLLKQQINLKQRLKKLVIDFKNEYLQTNSDNLDEANAKFNSLLQSMSINPNDCSIDDNNNHINIEDFDENDTSNRNQTNSYDQTEKSVKETVIKYNRKRSSNSLSTIIGLKTIIQPTQSLQLQLQNQLKLQKHAKRITGQRNRHYSVDETTIDKQRNRKKTISMSKNDFDSNIDAENDEFENDDNYSIDETNTTVDLDMDSNSINYDDKDGENTRTAIDDEESRDLIINEDEDDTNSQNKSTKEENIDVEALSEKSNSPISVGNPARIVIQAGNNFINGFNNRQSQILISKNPSKIIANSNFNGINQQIPPILNFSSANSFLKTTNLVNRGSIRNGTSLMSSNNNNNLNLNSLKTSIQESTSNNNNVIDAKSLNIKSLSISPNSSFSMSIVNMKNQESNKNIVKHVILNSGTTQQLLNQNGANLKN
ncbi:unnamed protein product [Brachionus calyciflorus]|uniref:BHLH domain-containing protein n=1 Tax=Brachionus calyciflorus TaxID=104777 RepID=A0A813M4W2_9BILA|nr:unnamed protein product [Brachionus calyciflorus]